MAGYLIADIEVTNQEMFAEFAAGILALVESRNGKYLVRGGTTEVVDGYHTPHRVVIIEFGSFEEVRDFVHSPEYVELAQLRHDSSIGSTIIVEGV